MGTPETTTAFQNSIKSSDTELWNKVNKISELTGCSLDLAATALFDSDNQLEIAINKIFETTQKLADDWKEVAKNKKKISSLESNANDGIVDKEFKDEETRNISDKQKFSRSRGRGRNNRTSGRQSEQVGKGSSKDEINDYNGMVRNSLPRSRGRRQQFRNGPSRGRAKQRSNNTPDNIQNDEFVDNDNDNKSIQDDKWPNYEDWLTEEPEKSFDYNVEKSELNQSVDVSQKLNCALILEKSDQSIVCSDEVKNKAVDIHQLESTKSKSNVEVVAKSSTKDEIFGDYSRTKPPPPSSVNLSEPVRMLTSTGIVSGIPKSEYSFSFGLNFDELSDKSIISFTNVPDKNAVNGTINTLKSTPSVNPQSFISNLISDSVDIKSTNQPEINTKFSQLKSDNYKNNIESHPLRKSSENGRPVDLFSSPSTVSHEVLNISEKAIVIDQVKSQNLKSSENAIPPLSISSNPTMLSTPHNVLQPPPGMSNPHLLQQFQNSHQQYFNMLNIPNGNSLYSSNIPLSESNDNQILNNESVSDSHHIHHQSSQIMSESSKEFNQKPVISKQNISNVMSSSSQNFVSKINDSSNSDVVATQPSNMMPPPHHISQLPMPLNCYLSQMIMNNFSNFLPQVHGHNSSSQQSEIQNQSNPINKQFFHMQPGHRNFPLQSEDYIDSNKFDDIQTKPSHKYRSQNYSQNFGSKDEPNENTIDKSNQKMSNAQQLNSRQSNSAQSNLIAPSSTSAVAGGNRVSQSHQHHQVSTSNQHQQPSSMPNDHRRITYHYPQSPHPYNSNIYNCVTAAGPHPNGPHPYAMGGPPPQPNGMQPLHPAQLHLMPQQMHNFPTSYQYSEHLVNSMAPNANSRNSMTMSGNVSGGVSSNNGGGPNTNSSVSSHNVVSAVNSNSGNNHQSRSRGNGGNTGGSGGPPQPNLWHNN